MTTQLLLIRCEWCCWMDFNTRKFQIEYHHSMIYFKPLQFSSCVHIRCNFWIQYFPPFAWQSYESYFSTHSQVKNIGIETKAKGKEWIISSEKRMPTKRCFFLRTKSNSLPISRQNFNVFRTRCYCFRNFENVCICCL